MKTKWVLQKVTTGYIHSTIGNEYRGAGSREAMLQSEVEGGLCSSHSHETLRVSAVNCFDPDLSNRYAQD